MRRDSGAAVLIPAGIFFVVAAVVLWSHPDFLARRNFPFNWPRDESVPRRWVAAAPFASLGVALLILGTFAL